MVEKFETIRHQYWGQSNVQGIIVEVFFEYVLDLWVIRVTEENKMGALTLGNRRSLSSFLLLLVI